MTDQKGDQYETRLAMAALAACIVRTLGERDATFVPRALENIERVYHEIRDSGQDHLGTLETLQNLRELLK